MSANLKSINTINYTAIHLLERLGNHHPTQQQIDLAEFLLLLAIRPNKMSLAMLEASMENDAIIRDFLKNFLRRQEAA